MAACVRLDTIQITKDNLKNAIQTYSLCSPSSQGGGKKGGAGGKEICVCNDTYGTTISVVPSEILDNIVNSNQLILKDMFHFSLIAKEYARFAPMSVAEGDEQLAAEMLMNRLVDYFTELVEKKMEDGKSYTYGIQVKNNASPEVTKDFSINIFPERNTFRWAIITRQNKPSTSSTKQFSYVEDTLANIGPTLKKQLSQFLLPNGQFYPHIKLRVLVGGETDNYTFCEVDGKRDANGEKLELIVNAYDKLKNTHGYNFPIPSLFEGGGRGGSGDKVFYKGYHYKIREEGRTRFIMTKNEGRVSITKVKQWMKKNKKA